MEFNIGKKRIERTRREYHLVTIFFALALIIGVLGIAGSKPNLIRLVVASAYIVIFCFLIKRNQSDCHKEILSMQNHQLVVENDKIVSKTDGLSKEIDLKNIYSISFKYKKKAINSIVIDIEKNCRVKIEGYEKMDVITGLIKKSAGRDGIR